MSKSFVINRAALPVIAMLLIAGCDNPSTSTDRSAGSANKSVSADDSTESVKEFAGQKNVTFYVAGMNKKLDIY